MGFKYTGFADEAADGIAGQIEATRRLGWSSIESRNVDGANITDIDDEAFDRVVAALAEAGVRVDCFGSAVANWAKDPRKEADFERSVAELSRALPRMERLGAKMIRGMSFAIVKDEAPDSPELTALVLKRLSVLVRSCEEAGVTYLHENCMNYGGLSYEHTLRLVEALRSPAFALVFDTGNPVFSLDHRFPPPRPFQKSWDFYRAVREHIRHVHIKDQVYLGPSDGIFPRARYTLPGEGDGEVERIVADLARTGYDGFLSIEPHTDIVHHEGDPVSPADARMAAYVRYGRSLMDLVARVGG